MTMNRLAFLIASAAIASAAWAVESPELTALAERVAPGAHDRFIFDRTGADSIYFTLDNAPDGRIIIRGNDNISLAVGLNHYFRNYLHQQVSWANPTVHLPETLTPVRTGEGLSTSLPWRYYLNYCTHSYSMAFWDWERWQQEIDWMALHGINLPLAATGLEAVWKATLDSLGYPAESTRKFIAGPAYQAWWLMNNLEGWGGPVDDKWIESRADLQKRILERMRSLDMSPVLPGYSGMVPHDARETLGLDVADPGLWCDFTRPGFLQPTDTAFNRVADTYYRELTRLYGQASHYSMDPFHEGGNTSGIDLKASGRVILDAMRRVNPEAVWVIQGWGSNPQAAMIDSISPSDLLILDLWTEAHPQWRTTLYGKHERIHCLLVNYGGNVGMYGKMRHTADEYAASAAPGASTSPLRGVGATMEGIGDNEVMFSLLFDLPWHPEITSTPEGLDKWLDSYALSRYGESEGIENLQSAWHLLKNSIYNCPAESRQQGPTEALFCARPAIGVTNASTWANASVYWDKHEIVKAADLFASAADGRDSNLNYSHDLTDIRRQVIADAGRSAFDSISTAISRRDTASLRRHGDKFLALILEEDSLLNPHPEFNVATWLKAARESAEDCGIDPALNEWNARTQLTVWGNRGAADRGGLHDYANKEWAGLHRTFYYPRWKLWLDEIHHALAEGRDPADVTIDWYDIEVPWTKQ